MYSVPYIIFCTARGFCIEHSVREILAEGQYEVFIDAGHKPGHLTYVELFIKGDREEEIFISTYICNPSMANNELSGPVVTTELAKWLLSLPERRYSYRIVFVPETIGAIAYIASNLEALKARVVAGFNLTCVGDERTIPSCHQAGNTISDAVAHVPKHLCGTFESLDGVTGEVTSGTAPRASIFPLFRLCGANMVPSQNTTSSMIWTIS